MAHRQRKQTDSAGQPTISVRAERSAQSLTAERTALRRRRLLTIGMPGLALVLLVSGLFYACGSQPSVSPAPLAEESTTVAAATQPTAGAAAQPVATAAPAAVSTQPTSAALTSSSVGCPDIAGLPIYANAACIKYDTDQDDGITKNENTYLASASADTVRRFYEGAFSQNGWAVTESKQHAEDSSWEYTIIQGQRRLKVEVEAASEASAGATRLTIKELSPIALSSATAQPASASTTCTAVTGLPLVANATCVKHDSDQDDGVIKNENTYVTSTAVDDVRRFYEGAFSQNGWTIAESKHDVEDNAWSYTITQAQQRLKVEIEPGQGANGAVTRITIAEK